MRPDKSVVLVEFNELVPDLLARFMAQGRLPAFRRLHDESHVFLGDAGERPPYLEPWIQWVTVHTGVPYLEHQIFNLSEGHKLGYRCIWDFVSADGHPVW